MIPIFLPKKVVHRLPITVYFPCPLPPSAVEPFVEAARALGATHSRILFRHILPNVVGVVIVYVCLTIPSIILYESFLSYLGLGIQPPMASWGSLIAEGAAQLNPIRMYWWLIVFPTLSMVLTLLALNFVGDGLRDAVERS